MSESESRHPAGADPGDDERSGDNVVEGVETLAAGTRSGGVQESPDDAHPGRAPVEQVGGDEDMTEGREVSGTGELDRDAQGTDPSAAPTSAGVSGGAQSIAGGRVSDRVSSEEPESPDDEPMQ